MLDSKRTILLTAAGAAVVACLLAVTGFTAGPSISLGLNPQKTFIFQTKLSKGGIASDKKLVFEVTQGQTFLIDEVRHVSSGYVNSPCTRVCVLQDGASLLCGSGFAFEHGIAVPSGSKIELYLESCETDVQVTAVLNGHLMKN